MITKYISSKTVIAKVYADLNLKEDGNRVTDIQEWIGEAIEHIGSVKQLRNKVSGVDGEPILKINNHLATMPCDLHRLNQVAFSISEDGPWYPMRLATGSFDIWSDDDNDLGCDNEVDLLSVPDKLMVEVMMQLYLEQPEHPIYGNLYKQPYKRALEIINSDLRTRSLVTQMLTKHGYITNFKVRQTNYSRDLQYIIKPGFINTITKNGYLKLSYSAVAVDEEGYPMIPDLVSYTEAIYWYITMKLKYPEYLNGKMNREIYYDIKRSWNFYSKQAYAESLLPNNDEMESFKNNWLKIVPEITEHDNFYSTAGERQYIYTKTNNRYRYGRY